MCIARVLLLGLLPFLSFRGPVCERKRQSFTMEGNNSQGNEATPPTNYFDEIVPSVRAFLFLMAAFGLFTIMILIIIFLFVKILRVMYPLPTPRATDTPVNLQPAQEEPEASNASSGSQQVRFRGVNGQAEAESGVNYADMSYPLTPFQSRAASPTTSTPSNPLSTPESPGLSPLNPFSPNYAEGSSYIQPNSPRSPDPYPSDRAERTPVNPNNSMFEMSSFSRKKEKFPDTFSGTRSELRDWLVHFDMIARLNGWNEAEKGTHLAISLRGAAQQVLRDLPLEERENYVCVVRALKRRYDPEQRESLKRMEFRNRHKKKDETVSEYGFVLIRMVTSAYPNLSQQAREDLAVEQFITGLPTKEIQQHVQFSRPKSMEQATSLATEFESFNIRYEGRKPENRSVRVVKEEDDSLSKYMKDFLTGQKELMDHLKGLDKNQSSPLSNACNGRGIRSLLASLDHQAYPQSPQPLPKDRVFHGPPRLPPVRRCYGCGSRNHFVAQCKNPTRSMGDPLPKPRST